MDTMPFCMCHSDSAVYCFQIDESHNCSRPMKCACFRLRAVSGTCTPSNTAKIAMRDFLVQLLFESSHDVAGTTFCVRLCDIWQACGGKEHFPNGLVNLSLPLPLPSESNVYLQCAATPISGEGGRERERERETLVHQEHAREDKRNIAIP